MSYIEDKITIKEYLDNIQDKGKKNHIKSILNQFDIFCKQKYEKSNQQVMDDLYEEQKNEDTKNKVYIVFNHFKNWMLIDHPEIVYFMGKKKNQRRTIKKRHANTIVTYLTEIIQTDGFIEYKEAVPSIAMLCKIKTGHGSTQSVREYINMLTSREGPFLIIKNDEKKRIIVKRTGK